MPPDVRYCITPTVDFEARVETTIESIQQNDDIAPRKQGTDSEFKRDLKLADMSDAWLQKLIAHLKIIAEQVSDARFEDMDEDDVKEPYAKADPDDLETKEAVLDRVADKVAERIKYQS